MNVSHGRSGNPELIVRSIFLGDSVPVVWEPETQEAMHRPEFSKKPGELVESFPANSPRVLTVGLGSRSDMNASVLRKAAASVARRIDFLKVKNVHFDLDIDRAEHAAGVTFGEALGICSWQSKSLKGTGTPDLERTAVTVCSLDEEFDKGLLRGLAIAESVNLARTLAWSPPNIATPAWMAGQAERLEPLGVAVRIVRGAELEQERLEGLINVGKASNHEPCLIRLEYTPARSKHKKPVVLIGKTITFDSGGLAIKSKDGMKGMKGDKSGGCAVLGTMHAIATVLKPDFPVVGILVAAENSISDKAFRMDDVLTFRNGVTVEVTNTDAEGRLVLADGLCWACEKEDPRCVIDIATLTGGVVTALGSVYAGLFSNDDSLAREIRDAGERSGELVWRLPLHSEYTESMRSEIADLVNSAPSRGAHPIQGAAFLGEFVKPGVPWAHIDIAGTAKTDREKEAYGAGPTGFGVKLLSQYIESL